MDASILINSAALHYALHYHTGAVDWEEQDKEDLCKCSSEHTYKQ